MIRVLHKAAETWGYPASFLTDNGLIFTTQRHHEVAGVTEQELFALGIEAKHSRPYHPQTCGKVERFHQTMKKFLAAQEGVETKKQLQRALDRFVAYYNEVRPHRGIGRRTPASVFDAREKAGPSPSFVKVDERRLRLDRIDKARASDAAPRRHASTTSASAMPTPDGGSPCSSTVSTSRSWVSTAHHCAAWSSIRPRTTSASLDAESPGLRCLETSVSDVLTTSHRSG